MIEKKLNYTAVEPERALIVAVVRQGQSDLQTKEYLDELAFLASTSNIITLGVYTQKLEKPERFAYVGKGKLEEVQAAVQAYNIDCVIFDDDLTPAQVRNLENQLQIKILDRSLLILNIFSMRAQTSQSKAQVELAQYQYLYPRLTRMWTHLTKQRGGAGMRGPGEKELETDRRIVNDRISLLKEKLRHIERQSDTRKKLRDRLVRVAIVGYTNVGKSTLMNRLTQAGVLAENKLFATVDSTVRKATIGDIPYLLTDTVGFIRKLPTHLIEAFKSTLDEVREADVLLHVVDISSPFHIKQMEVVNGILADIGAGDKPMILAYNKIDPLPKEPEGDELLTDAHLAAEATQHLRQALPEGSPKLNAAILKTIEISAEMNIGIQELRHMIFDVVKPLHQSIYPNYMEQVVW